MTLNRIQLEDVYRSYGYEIINDFDPILVFLYKKGRYFGVDIVSLSNYDNNEKEIQRIHDNYSNLGYAVNIKNFITEDEVEVELFKSFFSYDTGLKRLDKKYSEFVDKQSKNLLGSRYEYIESPFEDYEKNDSNDERSLLDTIDSILSKDKSQLIIIEAAAGYGKTCAAYEILNRLLNNKKSIIFPLFTELSKNRGAKIFRYILLDEIDIEFPTLNSELVIHEIKCGRIPLIIDGFDELLDKVNVTNIDLSSSFEEIESMLDTIGSLLENKSKIILTTRKTAIFSGIEFDRWKQKWNNKFEVHRFSLKEPRIKDWVGLDRFAIIREKNIPIQYIANPVLLNFLKNIEIDIFNVLLDNPDLLIDQYFERLLERERERQNLVITVDKQYEIFKNVARMLLEFDITVESKEFFKEIIKDQNSKLLEYARTLYTGQNKPTVENLVDTLATHALLDRKGRDGSQIGFINEFIFGVFIGEIICETTIEKIENDYSYYMLDLACTAYRVQNKAVKANLWDKVNGVIHKLQPISIFIYDIILKEQLEREYSELTIYDFTFFNIEFKGYKIVNSIYLNCYFKGCVFDIHYLIGVSFIECTFDNCTIVNANFIDDSKEISCIKCKVKDCQIINKYEYHPIDEDQLFSDFEKRVLREIMEMPEAKMQHILILLQKFEKSKSKQLLNSLESLESRDFIVIKGNHISFNINKLPIIKTELN